MCSASSHDAGSTAMVARNGLRALVANDSECVAEAIRSLLESAGFDVAQPAGTLAEAERLSDASQIDVAVVELKLNGEMSCGLIEWLTDCGISVIVVSGYELPSPLAAKVAAVISKPIRAKDLSTALRHVVIARAGMGWCSPVNDTI